MAKYEVFVILSLFILICQSQKPENETEVIQILKDSDYEIQRPCAFYDTECIRKFLHEHSYCKIAKRSVPDPYFRTQSNFYYPSFNISASQIGVYYSGGRGSVEKFKVDKENNQLLIQLRFRNAAINSTLDVYRFFRDGKEPAVTRSNSFAVFPSFTTTTIFRDLKHLDLARSETVGFLDTLPFPFVLNPSAGIHPDPIVAEMFAIFLANPEIVVQEALLTGVSFYAGNYIQYTLCDFGLKIF